MPINSIKSLYGPPKVGGDTLSFCSRCKMELAHVIASMVDGRPAKVICKTCKSQHNFKRIGDIGASKRSSSPGQRAASAKRYPTASAMRVAELWEQKMAENQLAPVKPYEVTLAYAKGDVIQHSKFGVGLVEEVRGSKLIVLFRDAEKTLVHAVNAN
jgi:hypothetical protein